MKVCKYCGCDKEREAGGYKVYESTGDGLTVKWEYPNLPSWITDAPVFPLAKSLFACYCPCHFKDIDTYVKAAKEILGIE